MHIPKPPVPVVLVHLVVLIFGAAVGTLIFHAARAEAQTPYKMVYQMTVTNDELVFGITNAERWKNFALLQDEVAWAAYFAGRESVYREQRAALWESVGLPQPPINPPKPIDK